jgi:hypothetical protein
MEACTLLRRGGGHVCAKRVHRCGRPAHVPRRGRRGSSGSGCGCVARGWLSVSATQTPAGSRGRAAGPPRRTSRRTACGCAKVSSACMQLLSGGDAENGRSDAAARHHWVAVPRQSHAQRIIRAQRKRSGCRLSAPLRARAGTSVVVCGVTGSDAHTRAVAWQPVLAGFQLDLCVLHQNSSCAQGARN